MKIKKLAKIPITTRLVNIFLPLNYPQSVSGNYHKFAGWLFVNNTCGAFLSVLSTSSLLSALGMIGHEKNLLSGPLNWIIRDGLGQFGGVAFVGFYAKKFDIHMKKLRFYSVVGMQLATFLELLTPFFPWMFLIVGSAANIVKNISMLASSATRAAINITFCKEGNLGDVTAKSGSQNTLAGLIGTGAAISYLFTNPSFINLVYMSLPFSFVAMYTNYKSNLYVNSNILCLQKLELWLKSQLSVEEINNEEKFILPFQSKCFSNLTINSKNPLHLLYLSDYKPLENQKYFFIVELGHKFLWFEKNATFKDELTAFLNIYYYSLNHSIEKSRELVKENFDSIYCKLMQQNWDMNIHHFHKTENFIEIESERQ